MKYDYIEGTKKTAGADAAQDAIREKRGKREEGERNGRETVDETLQELERDYNRCYRIIRKTYEYLERVGLQDFNKFSKYKWSFDRDKRGVSYVCVRDGGSLLKKSLVKRSGSLEDAELLRWLDNKTLVCDALDEAYEYIDEKVDKLICKMNEMKEHIQRYEDRGRGIEEDMEAMKVLKPDAGKKQP
jgi:hypothetical protein